MGPSCAHACRVWGCVLSGYRCWRGCSTSEHMCSQHSCLKSSATCLKTSMKLYCLWAQLKAVYYISSGSVRNLGWAKKEKGEGGREEERTPLLRWHWPPYPGYWNNKASKRHTKSQEWSMEKVLQSRTLLSSLFLFFLFSSFFPLPPFLLSLLLSSSLCCPFSASGQVHLQEKPSWGLWVKMWPAKLNGGKPRSRTPFKKGTRAPCPFLLGKWANITSTTHSVEAYKVMN